MLFLDGMESGRSRSRAGGDFGSPSKSENATGGATRGGREGAGGGGGSSRLTPQQQRLRWDSRALLRLAEAVDRLDISKHWNYGSKTKFWYKVLRELSNDEDRDTHLQPHINTLNQKFGEMYDAYEAGFLGLNLPLAGKGKLTPDDLQPELKAILGRIYEKFKHVRSHKVAISGNHVSQLAGGTPESSARKRKSAAPMDARSPGQSGSPDLPYRDVRHGDAYYGHTEGGRRSVHEEMMASQSYKAAVHAQASGNPYLDMRHMYSHHQAAHGESSEAGFGGHMSGYPGYSPFMYGFPGAHQQQHYAQASQADKTSASTMQMLAKSMSQAVQKLDDYLEIAKSELDLARKFKAKQAELATQQLALLEQKLQEDRKHHDCLQLLIEEQQRFLQSIRSLSATMSSPQRGDPRKRYR